MDALGLLPVVMLLAGSDFLPGSGGVRSAVPPVHAVLRAHSLPEGSHQVPAILLVRRGARIGTTPGPVRCAVPGHAHDLDEAPRPDARRPLPARKGRRRPSRRDGPAGERPPPSPIS